MNLFSKGSAVIDRCMTACDCSYPFSFSYVMLGIVAVSLLMGNGCAFRKPQPATRLYVLTALPRTESALPATGGQGVAVGIGPVSLPQYVDRPQIVTGTNSNELRRASFEQWAEPLENNFTRVLTENMSVLLSTAHVVPFSLQGPIPTDYQVVVGVTRFLGEPGGVVSLEALWSIVGQDGRSVLLSRQSSFTEQVGGEGYDALASAMSRTVAALSRDIAAAVTSLPQKSSAP